METIRFIVQGSADEPYVTTFVKRSTFSLSAYCTCPAGQSGLYCKHRFMILEGVDPGIVSNNNHEISLVVNWLAGTDVEQAINLMKELEDDLADIKARVKRAKAHVAQVMRGQ